MIDTIGLSIPITKKFYKQIKEKSVEISKVNNCTGDVSFRFYNYEVSVPSYDRNISIFLNDVEPDKIKIEFSVPKMFFGHNVFLLYQNRLYDVVSSVRSSIINCFGDCPDLSIWEVYRLDLCYNWLYKDHDTAQAVIDVLKSFDITRKRCSVHRTSIMEAGTYYSTKFYLKQDEYKIHDFANLRQKNLNFAYDVLLYSAGVLRFETTLRKKQLAYEFKKQAVFLTDIISSDLQAMLLTYFKKALRGTTFDFITPYEALGKLKKSFRQVKAFRLWTFYQLKMGDIPDMPMIIRENYSRSTISRNNHDLLKAGVGLPLKTEAFNNLDLNIPSKYVTNIPSDSAPALSVCAPPSTNSGGALQICNNDINMVQ